MPTQPSAQQLAQANAALRSPQVQARIQQIRADPRYAQSVPLQHQAISTYLFNDPSSPLYDVNQAGDRSSGPRGNGAFRYNIEDNAIQWEPLGPQHWYSDPGVMGPILVGAATGVGLAAGAGGAGGAAPSLAEPAVNAAGTVAPGVVNLGGGAALVPGTVAPGAAPLGSLSVPAAPAAGAPAAASWLDKLKSPNNLASLAGIITSLSGGGGGGGGGNTAETQRIQAITEARMRRVDPLHQMVTQLAASRMPINVQRPVPDVPLP